MNYEGGKEKQIRLQRYCFFLIYANFSTTFLHFLSNYLIINQLQKLYQPLTKTLTLHQLFLKNLKQPQPPSEFEKSTSRIPRYTHKKVPPLSKAGDTANKSNMPYASTFEIHNKI